MSYGLYLSASGVLTNMYRQDVFANNLANVETVGFKPDQPMIRQRDPEAVEEGFSSTLRQHLLNRLGGGALAGPQTMDARPGALRQTHGALDAALETPHAYFAVRSAGETGVRLTRDGRFAIDPQGRLVTATGGHLVLDDQDNPIAVGDAGQVGLDAQGGVRQGGELVARMQIAQMDPETRLVKLGGNLLSWEGSKDPRQSNKGAPPALRPGFVEGSGVDPIKALMDLMDATRSIANGATMIRYHDQVMDQAVNTLGRV